MEFIVLLLLLLAAGWVLGLIGFFKALRALREVAMLRAQLATASTTPAEAAAAPVISPWVAPEPAVVEPPPPEIAPAAPEVAEPAEPEPGLAPPRPPRDLEALLTQRWGIWLGAAALLLSGVFLVRYAVDQGLLGPAVRCTLAALLGVALVAGAEWLSRRPAGDEGRLGRDQMPPALAAGGVAVLFGAAYGVGPLYDLVPPIIGFILLAAVALAGLALSLRQGALVAAIGIAGAYITPALVAADAPYAPGLFGYLLLVTAAALAVVRHTAWAWLGWAATIAGAIWVALAATGGLGPETWAPGLFVPAAACLHLLLLPGAALKHPVGRRPVLAAVRRIGRRRAAAGRCGARSLGARRVAAAVAAGGVARRHRAAARPAAVAVGAGVPAHPAGLGAAGLAAHRRGAGHRRLRDGGAAGRLGAGGDPAAARHRRPAGRILRAGRAVAGTPAAAPVAVVGAGCRGAGADPGSHLRAGRAVPAGDPVGIRGAGADRRAGGGGLGGAVRPAARRGTRGRRGGGFGR